jgi:hypothetical protein
MFSRWINKLMHLETKNHTQPATALYVLPIHRPKGVETGFVTGYRRINKKLNTRPYKARNSIIYVVNQLAKKCISQPNSLTS